MDVATRAYYKNCLKGYAEETQKRSGSVPLNFREDKLDEVIDHYNVYVQLIKSQMPDGDGLDLHKHAAALCCAVLKAHVLEPVSGSTPVSNNLYAANANELCAYLMGIQVLKDVWMCRSIDHRLPLPEQQIFNHIIYAPSPNDSANATYADWYVSLLKKDKIGGVWGNHFDYEDKYFDIKQVLFLSHIYYLIECFSYQYYRAEIAIQGGSRPGAPAAGVAV